jgi:enoyl-CoA hydratase/carnithine racemase
MSNENLVLLSVGEGVARLTLNRPEALNAWTPEMEERWNQLLDQCVADTEVRAIVITGAGRGFCAGADAAALGRRARGEESKPVRSRPLTALLDVPKPIVAAINGACVGLGLALALCCDIRVAAVGAKLAAPFARRGLLAEFRTAQLLPAIVGRANALDLLVSGRTVVAEEAVTLGLVHRVVAPDELAAVAATCASDIAVNCSPHAVAGIKAQVRAALADGPEAVARLDDFAEGMLSLRERRPPRFPGLDGRTAGWVPLDQ